jgi:hypothetical protein
VPVLALLLLAAATAAADTAPEIRAMVKKSLAGINREDEVKGNYLFNILNDRREFDSDGKETSRKSWLVERMLVDGYLVGWVRERDGKPISDTERAQQQEGLRKHIEARKSQAPQKAPPQRKRSKDEEDWIQEFPEALDYKLVGEEAINGRPALVLDFVPRPGYRPTSMRARIFEKMKGRIWIDKADSEMARTEAEMFDTVSIGFGVAGRIYKGTSMRLSRRRVDEGVWLTEDQFFKFNARVMMVKSFHRQVSAKFTDFRLRPDRAPMAKGSR